MKGFIELFSRISAKIDGDAFRIRSAGNVVLKSADKVVMK